MREIIHYKIFAILTRNAPTKLGWRAPRRTHDIGAVRDRVDGAFGFEKARGWRRSRSKFASTTREFFKFPNFLNAFRFSFSQKVCALASDAVHKNVRRRRNARSSLRGVWHRGCARSASLSRKFGEKCGNSLQKFCDFDAQRSNKTRPACAATNARCRRILRSSRWRV